MNIEKPKNCDIELPEGWVYPQLSNGVYQIMKASGGKVSLYPEWLKGPNAELLPRIKFDSLTFAEAKTVIKVSEKGVKNYGDIIIWIIETCSGEWRPSFTGVFYFQDENDRIMFKLAWG